MAFELVGVPFSSMHPPGGISRAARVLRELGLVETAASGADVFDGGDLRLAVGAGSRGPSGLLNEAALAGLVAATREAVAGALARERTPVLFGADCPVLLGALAAGGDDGDVGLLLVDGHEDAWPPSRSPTGEASDSEVAIALGAVAELPPPLASLVPLVSLDSLALLGPRDREEIEAAGIDSLRDAAAWFAGDAEVRAMGAAAAAAAAIAALGSSGDAFWLHVDLDVLATDALGAVDYPQPGGFGWDDLHAIAREGLSAPACLGCSVVIYNPDLDDDLAGGRRIVRFVADLLSACAPS